MNGFKAWNLGSMRRKVMRILAMGRTMIVLALLSIVLFMLLGMGSLTESRIGSSPVSSMQGLAASMTGGFFKELLGMEVPHLKAEQEQASEVFSGKNMTNFVFQLLTNINPSDPKSLVSREVPGLGSNSPVLLRASVGSHTPTAPEDYQTAGNLPSSSADIQGDGAKPFHSNATSKPGSPSNEGTTSPSKGTVTSEPKSILIYHSHPHESYNPLLNKQSSNPSSADPSKNVGIVGDLIAGELERKGIGTDHAFEDYMTTVSGYNYNYSYKYSRSLIKDVLAEFKSIQYFFDIHRDSQSYSRTTTAIKGVSYAQIYFIIGHGNPDWRKNEAFANKIHAKLEKKYPGLSRGIWGKSTAQGNGEYNQSISPNSVLIEVGGIDNTKQELDRTSKVLADTIADVYFEEQKAKKANAKLSNPNNNNGAPASPASNHL